MFEIAAEVPEDCLCRWRKRDDGNGGPIEHARLSTAMGCPVHEPRRDWPVERCSAKSCRQPVIWTRTERAKPMPVDEKPVMGGTIALSWGGTDQEPLVLSRVVPPTRRYGPLYVSHFASCPSADRFRSGRARR